MRRNVFAVLSRRELAIATIENRRRVYDDALVALPRKGERKLPNERARTRPRPRRETARDEHQEHDVRPGQQRT